MKQKLKSMKPTGYIGLSNPYFHVSKKVMPFESLKSREVFITKVVNLLMMWNLLSSFHFCNGVHLCAHEGPCTILSLFRPLSVESYDQLIKQLQIICHIVPELFVIPNVQRYYSYSLQRLKFQCTTFTAKK